MKKRHSTYSAFLKGLLLPVAVIAIVLFFTAALSSLDSGRQEESLHQLERALRRGCVACYAAEGIYPPDLDYLREHYGIQVDEERYVVYYDIFAENLMPVITVLEITS